VINQMLVLLALVVVVATVIVIVRPATNHYVDTENRQQLLG